MKTMRTRLLSFLLALIMTLATFGSVFVIAEDTNETVYSTWDGTSLDVEWESAGTNAYYIQSAAELAGLASQSASNPFSGYGFYITVHIDLGSHAWTPIGPTNTAYFGGNLYGALGKVSGSAVEIKNLSVTAANGNHGLVGTHGSGGSAIKDITLVDPVINSGSYNTGACFVGYAKTTAKTYENLHVVNGTLNTAAAKWAGGIVAYTNQTATYTNCSFHGTINISGASAQLMGGITGQATGGAITINHCNVSGEINITSATSPNYIGGLVGGGAAACTALNMSGCVVTADMNIGSVTTGSNRLGGMLGVASALQNNFTNCYYGGTITSANTVNRLGGFVGQVNSNRPATFTNCQFDGVLDTRTTQNGAFVGRWDLGSSTSLSFTNCLMTGVSKNHYGDLDGFSWIGLVGNHGVTAPLSFSGCYTHMNTPIAAKNDYNAENLQKLTINGTLVTPANDRGYASVTMPALLSGGATLDSSIWTVEAGKNPVLTVAAEVERPYAAADLSWFAPRSSTAFVIDSAADMIGLAQLSQLSLFSNTAYTYTVYDNLVGTVDAALFRDGFRDSIAEHEDHLWYIAGKDAVETASIRVWAQLGGEDTTVNDASFDVRFVSTVSETGKNTYTEVGFVVEKNGIATTYASSAYYETISGGGATYLPSDMFGETSAYFFTATLEDIPNADLDQSFTVKAYLKYEDGTYAYGPEVTTTLRAAFFPNLPYPEESAIAQIANNYQIVYPAANANGERKIAQDLRNSINALLGVESHLTLTADSNATGTYEILIGYTSRVEEQDHDLGMYDYVIYRDGDRIVLLADTAWALNAAGEQLAKMLDSTTLTLDNVVYDGAFAVNPIARDLSLFTPVWADTHTTPEWMLNFDEKTYAVLAPATSAYRLTSKVHRGDRANYPDGSIEGYASSILAGVDVIEVDVRMTKDGIPVLLHDESLARTTNVEEFIGRAGYPTSMNVCDWTYAQLMDLNLTMDNSSVITPYKVATLYEMLILVSGRVFIHVEDKSNTILYGENKNLCHTSIPDGGDLIYRLADETNSKECFLYWFGQKGTGETTGMEDIEAWIARDPSDTDFARYVAKVKDYLTRSEHAFREDWWPANNTAGASATNAGALATNNNTLSENAETWAKMQANGYNMAWTENPAAICAYIAANCSATNYQDLYLVSSGDTASVSWGSIWIGLPTGNQE